MGVPGGVQALEKLQEQGFGAFDMVLMDVQMPGELRPTTNTAPAIALTENALSLRNGCP